MPEKKKPNPNPPDPPPGKPIAEQSAENELDALNEELRTGRDEPDDLRKKMEATIEEQARKRRSNEAPASSKIKKT